MASLVYRALFMLITLAKYLGMTMTEITAGFEAQLNRPGF